MNPKDAVELLKRMAAADQRTIGESDIEFWCDVLPEWVAVCDALTAVTNHYRMSTRRIMPADVFRGAKEARARRLGYAIQDTA